MYLENPSSLLSQGDIFAQIDLTDAAFPQSPPKRYNIIVLSHSCEIDKENNYIALVCAILPLGEVDEGVRRDIRKNKTYHTMYLDAVGGLPESFIDFRYVFRVKKEFLQECTREGFKAASLDEEAQLALVHFFYRFISRRSLKREKGQASFKKARLYLKKWVRVLTEKFFK